MNRIRLSAKLKEHEGFRSHPYRDTEGWLTVGYGRNLETAGLTKAEAHALLENDIARVEQALRQKLEWFERLDDARQEALVSMGFNLGIGGLLGFRKMLRAIEEREWGVAAKEALDSKWARQVGARAIEVAETLGTGRWL